MTPEPAQKSFRVERHGDIAVVIPSPEVESMHENLIQQAAQMVLAPLKEDPPAGLVIDLTQVSYFGSVFLSFLLRCHMLAKKHGSEVVLAGASEPPSTRSGPCTTLEPKPLKLSPARIRCRN